MPDTNQMTLLTEEQVLRAPSGDYMNDAQLAFFRARLSAMLAEVQHARNDATESLSNEITEADPSDRATREEERALELRSRDRDRNLAEKISRALARIDAGTYGYCEETDEPIGIPRLLARPTAELTIDAQERHERRKSTGSA